ncbi:MAG: ribosomal protein S18-alanine N-acetyltransferase [Oscillospiraceae bacterium]|nr:ribosomal protein S18-alanine N-acetyltransferase [Oscillospiraceae bacterium]
MDIVAASPEMLEQIVRIEDESFSDPWSPESLRGAMEDSLCRFTAAAEGGEVLGYCIMHCLYEQAELYSIAVSPEYRRQGTAKLLLEDALAWARAAGAGSVLLEVRRSNAPARALYEALGFEQISVRKKYYTAPTEDAVIMQKML